MQHAQKHSKSFYLIALCWLVYTCSYIGKLSYNANINQMGLAFQVPYAQTGSVSTFFFFAYGAGQIVNGFCCKKYNIRWVIFISLLIASAMNVLIAVISTFALLKFVWLINGAAMSFLWTSLIRLLSETLNKQDVNKAIVVMGTTVATGTFLVYGMSSIFAAIGIFRTTFFVAAGIMVAVSLLWFFAFRSLVNPLQEERAQEQTQTSQETNNSVAAYSYVGLLLGVLAFFAVANNFIKDGLTAWTPDILSAVYNTPGWLSILLTLLLPVMAIFGTVVAMRVYKTVKNFVGTCVVLYVGSALFIGLVILFLSTSAMPVTVACFALVACLMAGVNNVITSLVPLKLKTKMGAGKLAGILNGFCYLGSTISAYGLGAIADNFGWNAVFYTLLGVCLFVLMLGGAYLTFQATKNKTINKSVNN